MGGAEWTQTLLHHESNLEDYIMHNLMSQNQLADWRHIEDNLDRCNEELDLINDYFNCLIECDDDQNSCKKIWRDLLQGWRIKELY